MFQDNPLLAQLKQQLRDNLPKKKKGSFAPLTVASAFWKPITGVKATSLHHSR